MKANSRLKVDQHPRNSSYVQSLLWVNRKKGNGKYCVRTYGKY